MELHPADSGIEDSSMLPERARARLVRCLVTPVDGAGHGSIGISVNQGIDAGPPRFFAICGPGSVMRWEKSRPSRRPRAVCSTTLQSRPDQPAPAIFLNWPWCFSREA